MEKIKRCKICERQGLIRHHIRYNFPEEVIMVCGSCHKKIHLSDMFAYPEFIKYKATDEKPNGFKWKRNIPLSPQFV